MSEYLDFLEACEYAELTALLIEQDIKAEATNLVRDCAGDVKKKDSPAQDTETW